MKNNQRLSLMVLWLLLILPVFLMHDTTPVLAAEEDEEDNFTAMPNYRWVNQTTTDSNVVERLIGNDYYSIQNTNNETSGNQKIEKSRQLIDRDFYVDTKFQLDLGGDQIEWFRDIKGDECDFTEGDQEDLTGVYLYTPTIENGVLKGNGNGYGYAAVVHGGDHGSYALQRTVRTRVRADFPFKTVVYWNWDYTDFWGNVVSNQTSQLAPYVWHEVELTIPVNVYDYNLERLRISINRDDGSMIESTDWYYWDYIEQYLDLDYASHIEGEVEDSWNWDDSDDYFHDEEDDICDFNTPKDYWIVEEENASDFEDGSLEDWSAGAGSILVENVNLFGSKWIHANTTGSTNRINATGLSVDASQYEWLKFRFYFTGGIVSMSQITIRDADDNTLVLDSTGWAKDTIYEVVYNLSCAYWTGTETQVYIKFSYIGSGTKDVYMDFAYLTEYGHAETEGWIGNGADDTVELQGGYKDGWINASRSSAGSIYVHINMSRTLNIVSSTYRYISLEIYPTSGLIDAVIFYDIDDNELGNYGTDIPQNTLGKVYKDLGLDADWTGTEVNLHILFVFNQSETYQEVHMNVTLLQDLPYGDLESMSGFNDLYTYINPTGIFTTVTTANDPYFNIEGDRVINSAIFDRLIIRFKSSLVDSGVGLFAWYTGGYEYKNLLPTFEVNTWITLDYDLTQFDCWDGRLIGALRLDIPQGTIPAGEYVYYDYILLTGNWSSSPVKFSLLTRENVEGAYIQFSRNNSITDEYLIEVDFLDYYGIALHYEYAFNYSREDGWLLLDMNFNLNKKTLRIDFKYEGGSSIVRARSFYDLYGVMGTPNLIITSVGDPQFCINASQSAYGRAHFIIDYIDADWKILDWHRPMQTSPVLGNIGGDITYDQDLEADFINQYAMELYGDLYDAGAVSQEAWFMLPVDRFDGFSFDISSIAKDIEGSVIGDKVETDIWLANVMPNGTLDPLIMFSILTGKTGATDYTAYHLDWFEPDGTGHTGQMISLTATAGEASVSMYLDMAENEVIAQAQCKTGTGTTENLGINVTRTTPLTTEMVIFVGYGVYDELTSGGTDHFKVQISGFDLIRKGWLEDIVSSVLSGLVQLLSIVFAPFIMFFQWILSGLVKVGQTIVEGLSPVIEILGGIFTTAISGLQTAFGTIIDGLELALETALGLVKTAVDAVTAAVAALASDIWTLFLTLVSDLDTLIEALLLLAIDWIEVWITTYLNDFFFVFWDGIIAALGLTEFVNFIVDTIVNILTVLGGIMLLLGAFLGWCFAMGIFWLEPARLQAAGLVGLMVLIAWIIYPLIILFGYFVAGEYDENLWVGQLESFISKIGTVVSAFYTILVFVVELVLRTLTTIGNFIPLT
jgi:hypothetical protein